MESAGKLHSFSKSAIKVAELSASRCGHIFPVEETPSTGLVGAWTVPRDVLDAFEENFWPPARNRAKGLSLSPSVCSVEWWVCK